MAVCLHIGFTSMKHHGHYEVDTPEELKLNSRYYLDSEETRHYVNRSLQRIKAKYKNDKRHKQKIKLKQINGKRRRHNFKS